MDPQLKERAQKVAAFRDSRTAFTPEQINEVAEVYYQITGKTTNCRACNVYDFINRINRILKPEPLIIKNMATAKGIFKSNAASKEIIRHGKNGTILITPETLNEGDNFAFAAKHYSHLVEEAKAAKEETEAKTSAKK